MQKSKTTQAAVEALKKAKGIGLTGGIATGKSTVAAYLRLRGYIVIDADQLARQVVAPGSEGLAALQAAFGASILMDDGSLNRPALSKIIFSNDLIKEKLEALLHPRIAEALTNTLVSSGLLEAPRLFFYEAALLVETGRYRCFRDYWCTLCSPATQLSRLMTRNNCTEAEAKRMIASQMPSHAKAAGAAFVINTDGTLEDTKRAVDLALESYRP